MYIILSCTWLLFISAIPTSASPSSTSSPTLYYTTVIGASVGVVLGSLVIVAVVTTTVLCLRPRQIRPPAPRHPDISVNTYDTHGQQPPSSPAYPYGAAAASASPMDEPPPSYSEAFSAS